MSADGRVSGSDVQTPNSEYGLSAMVSLCCVQILHRNGNDYRCVFAGVLELKSVRTGHVVIRGKSSSLFLCMDSRGQLTGQV